MIPNAPLKQTLLWVALLACTGSASHAQGTFPTIAPFELGYSVRSWTMDDGLKGPYVGTFVQARDGSLLLSDSEGLIRYNGIELEDLIATATPEVPRRNILDIHEDADGRLWTVGLSGQAMRGTDGQWIPIGADRGGRSGVGKFARDRDGRLWCAVSSGSPNGLMVSVYDDGRFQPVLEEPLRTGYVQQLEFDAAGQLWLSVASQGSGASVFRLEGSSLVPEVAAGWRHGTLFRKEGDPRLWIATRNGIRVREADAWQEVVAFTNTLPERSGFSACVADGDGNYWIATRSLGLWVCQPDGRASRLVNEEVKFPNLIRDLFTGRDGTIWFNGENGLLQLRRQPLTVWPQTQRHRRAAIRAMAEDGEGVLWFGGNGIYSLRPGEFVRSHWQDDTAIPSVYALLGSPEGGAWFATGRSSLGSVSESAQRILAPSPKGSGQVLDLVGHDGQLWFGLSKNLLHLQDDALVPRLPEGVPPDILESLAMGAAGELYAGFRSKGLLRHQDGQWTPAGLDGQISALAVAPDQSVWARRGPHELCWLSDGEWHHADTREMGIPPLFHMVCSREGSIWFQGAKGPVVRIDRKAAESWLQGDRDVDLQLRSYGRAEGLPSEQAPYGPRKRALLEDGKGRIWIATVEGVCAWHPSHDAHSAAEAARTMPIPVLIENVLVDDQPVANLNGAVRLTPDEHRLEIQYAGLDLASPETVSYRYRIAGYEEEWISVGNRHTAYLHRMPPGSYEFQVIAADRHGVWNETGAALAITVLPHWWEHWLFRIGAPLACLFVLSSIAFFRVRSFRRRSLERVRLQDEFSRGLIEAQESERARIAGELHDDLGQDLLVMKSRIDLSRRRSESEKERELLEPLSESAGEVLRKMRSLSHQLRPPHLDHLGLAASIKSLVKEVAEASQMEYEVDAEDMAGTLTPEGEVAVYRILQEALNNVIKHAGANSVKVELRRHPSSASLLISDDGCGFDEKADGSGRNGHGQGLKSMGERCALIGGKLRISSVAGEGTLIRIDLPLNEGPT